ncbi:hypothetical protein PCNPT3_07450 [Psychromonas sp. CNPT3]|uniref:hypothetical protein n=1 Tax=Psychromonas sp. CNPT3 TaxID=314282 RepID=UPI00006E85C8|nr:hypothetical protein [Psychromonas sp. CNPT3]AGH81428.1 hypothetical protein PCNPT3_07450 [Psychromonas sp. CNPT3]
MPRFIIFFFFLCSSYSFAIEKLSPSLNDRQLDVLGALIWENEGSQKIKNLTHWNVGEAFPSLGIGHFIWYPSAQKGPFKEQFPALLNYFKAQGVQLPLWLTTAKYAPWKTREQFYAQFEQSQLEELRTLLSTHIRLQAAFIAQRLTTSIPDIVHSATPAEQLRIKENVQQLMKSPQGVFALLDYVNFKGEGLVISESYQGQAWGLKQVLLTMPMHYQNALRAFSYSADEVLTRRVKNAPKDESRWLKGWRVRIHAYQTLLIASSEEQ